MANPLQPKVIQTLEREYNAFTVNIVSASRAGVMDVLACVPKNTNNEILGIFYGFEIKWGKDRPSELQKEKINSLIDSGGRGYFITSIQQLKNILDYDVIPTKYKLKDKLVL